ncbi:MAG: tail-specific protease [Planctomycetes bacterium]|nr:tail-specific protease [Planctomycetota bacterium]
MTRATRITAVLALFSLGIVMVGPAIGQPDQKKDPLPTDRVMRLVRLLLEQEHISERELDDTISERAMKGYLESLDPLKLYFTQRDVNTIRKLEHDLDDIVRRGEDSFAHLVFKTFMKRIEERIAFIEKVIEEKIDYTTREYFITDPEVAVYATNQEQIDRRWRRRLKYDHLRLKLDKVEGAEARDQILRRYRNFRRRMRQVDAEEILGFFLGAITHAFDPHTAYIAPKPYEDFMIGMRLNYQGIGAHLQDQDGHIVITKVIPGGAVSKYGKLKDGDKILGVGQGKGGDILDVVGMKLSDVVKKIRGKEGTVVRLQVKPKGGGDTTIHELSRARIHIKEDRAQSKVFDIDGVKVGVIDLPSFYSDGAAARRGVKDYRSCTRDVRKLLEGFKKDGVDTVVLDLRWNGGGLLNEAIRLTGLFIDKGPVVQVKDGRGEVSCYNDRDAGMAWKGPLVILTSRFSASASEIIAGAVQDYKRGLVVGDPSTHGKGTVQQVMDLGDLITRRGKPPALGALKITMQKFYRPDGDSTQLRGVRSDVVVPALTGEVEGESSLDYALEFDHIPAAKHATLAMVSPAIKGQVQQLSKARTDASAAFKKTRTDIARYRKLRDLKMVPLEEKAFLALQEDRESGPEVEVPQSTNDETLRIRKDDFLSEVLRIAADYTKVLKGTV